MEKKEKEMLSCRDTNNIICNIYCNEWIILYTACGHFNFNTNGAYFYGRKKNTKSGEDTSLMNNLYPQTQWPQLLQVTHLKEN